MIAEAITTYTREGELWEPIDDQRIRCIACGHRCPIPEGLPGVCKVRSNRNGKLYVPWGYVAGLQCDPIEKKPFFHVHPGSLAMSFGMLGCSLHCPYCQNWFSSQSMRDPRAVGTFEPIEPSAIVQAAISAGAKAVISTYNEPLITAEWAVAIFRQAREAGLLRGIVSNGNATPQVLTYLRPWVDLFKVDLKSFRDGEYRKLGGRLRPVLDSIRQIHEMGFWLEVVTLIVPRFNDSAEELRGIAEFLASVSADIPWHVTAFHPDYKMSDRVRTPAATVIQAAEIGHSAGLQYVYAGNTPSAGTLENTYCAQCRNLLVRRNRFAVPQYEITSAGRCPRCSRAVPGVWADDKHANASSVVSK